MKVLVVEDAPEVVDTIKMCVSIRWPGSTVVTAMRGGDAARLVESEGPDVVLLDLGLPDVDGLDVLQEVRTFSDVPLLIISVQHDDLSRVKGLELGADDYIVKPFSHTELLARIRAVLRRAGNRALWNHEGIIGGPGLTIDLAGRRLMRNGSEVNLTPIEWNFLSYMARNAAKIIPHQVLAEKVWGGEDVNSSAIKMCVHRLRQKLGDNPRAPKLIRSHRGMGYSLTLPER
ncbi:MAG: response regulator transcription factor [Chloroflexi bacterium]|nr:response regulator transcription factor [Chloroflexota bacterium]